MKNPSQKDLEYNAVFGAFVALQVQERIRDGYGPPDYNLMRNFVEEAHAVAEMALEVQDWEPKEEDEG